MRSYPTNSPEAAARIIALLLISDGHVCRSETEVLHAMEVEHELGLAPRRFAQIVHTLCEDLLMGAHARHTLTSSVDEPTLSSLMSEVTQSELQQKVLHFALAAATADRYVAQGEAWVMDAALRHWNRVHLEEPHLAGQAQTEMQMQMQTHSAPVSA